MDDKTKQNQEPFFWVKSGEIAKRQSIHRPAVPKQPDEVVIEASSPKPIGLKHPKTIDTKRAGLQPGWTRASFIIGEENLQKIKAVAFWERRGIKDVLDEALRQYFESKKAVLAEAQRSSSTSGTGGKTG